ncbi:MAG: hypothetical protein K2K57_12525 [Oscillospiraceae bacterium]|nr:hypothetical protein [Oscillospiraceae bacterium]
MLEDSVNVDIWDNNLHILKSINLLLFDESDEDPEKVTIKIISGNSYSASNYFDALCLLRMDLEKDHMQLLCNGAVKEVYPSNMQLTMGCCRTGYIQYMGMRAQKKDIVDLFAFDRTLTPCDVAEQIEYHNRWLISLKKC